MNVHDVAQAALVILGVLSAFLTARKNKYWIITSLCSQPFWFYSAYKADQWGMIALCVVYTATTIYAIPTWWLKKD